MILVTLGTQKQQFRRLLEYIENSNIDSSIIVQSGYTKFVSNKMDIREFISYEEMDELIEKSDIVITHGGTGSVIWPLKKGKKVIACARLHKYGEHVDDHQTELVDVFSNEGYIKELNDEVDLDELVSHMSDFTPKQFVSNNKEFIKKLKAEID